MKTIFIPFNVPSLKNGKVPVTLGKKKHTTLVPAPAVKKYLQKIGIQKYSSGKKTVDEYKTRPNLFKEAVGDFFDGIEYPALLHFHFVRDSKRQFDFNNANAIICDLLTAHGFIEDDNMDYIVPEKLVIDGRLYSYDKVNPGVWVGCEKWEG